MRFPLLLFFLSALCAAPCMAAEPTEAPAPPRTVREALRTFASDGGWLLSFPKRTTPRGVWMTGAVIAGTALLVGRDDEIRREVLEARSERADRAADLFEPLGTYLVEGAGLGAAYAVARAVDRPAARATAGVAFEAFVWSALVTSVSKGIFGREPPAGDADADGFLSGGTIFPSGHTSRSFAIAAVIAERHPRVGWAAYPVAALVGLATVRQDTHWASDVLAGAGLGLAIGKGIASRHPVAGRRGEAGGRHGLEWSVAALPGGAAWRARF